MFGSDVVDRVLLFVAAAWKPAPGKSVASTQTGGTRSPVRLALWTFATLAVHPLRSSGKVHAAGRMQHVPVLVTSYADATWHVLHHRSSGPAGHFRCPPCTMSAVYTGGPPPEIFRCVVCHTMAPVQVARFVSHHRCACMSHT